MPQVQFPWLADGKPTELPDIPMAGDDELDALTERYAKTIVYQKRSFLLQRLLAILGVKRLVDLGKIPQAVAAWKEALQVVEPSQSRKFFEWSPEEFEAEFDGYFHQNVEVAHGVSGFEEANAKLLEELKSLEAELKTVATVRPREFQNERLVTDLYWRLKGAHKTILVDGEKVPLTKESLRQAIRLPGDYNHYLEALAGVRGRVNADEEREAFLEMPSEEDIKKKSPREGKSSRRSKTASPSTSAPTTAPGES